jgi:hypothetical protein
VQILQKDFMMKMPTFFLGEKVNAKLNPFLDGQVIEYISITVLQNPNRCCLSLLIIELPR